MGTWVCETTVAEFSHCHGWETSAGFLNAVVFTFYMFDIFQNQKAKICISEMYHQKSYTMKMYLSRSFFCEQKTFRKMRGGALCDLTWRI